MNCEDLYYKSTLIAVGGSHLRHERGGQDHAVALACPQGIVLAVADGVSIIDRDHSRAEVGAWLCAELVLVMTPCWTQAWASGDGYWGVLAAPWTDPDTLRSARYMREIHEEHHDDCISLTGARHHPKLRRLASTESQHSLERVLEQLECVLSFNGMPIGAYLATDGLRDEPALPARSKETLLETVARGDDTDDLGIAWAAERFPNLIPHRAPHG